MTAEQEIEFSSSYCKHDTHKRCNGKWAGVGFIIKCTCNCHINRKMDKGYKKNLPKDVVSKTIHHPTLKEIQFGGEYN